VNSELAGEVCHLYRGAFEFDMQRNAETPFFLARPLVAEQLEHPVVSEAEAVGVGSR
jgi:hypothetical protein